MVPLEAMASGAYVLANDTGALPEVLGPVGRLVPPTVAGWVEALTTVTRADVADGRAPAVARGRSFTWAASHRALLDVLAAAPARRQGPAGRGGRAGPTGRQRADDGSRPTLS
jgi:glycosyltransferase involved in cell wall biosynthesis